MQAIMKIATALQILEHKVNNVPLEGMSEAQQKLVGSFQTLLNAFIQQFHAARTRDDQMFHFAAIYALTQSHRKYFTPSTSYDQTFYFPSLPLIFATVSKKYDANLQEFLYNLSELFAKYINTEAAKQYVNPTGSGQFVEYSMGHHMAGETTQASTSLLQFEKRAFVIGYFDFIRDTNEEMVGQLNSGYFSTTLTLMACYIPAGVALGGIGMPILFRLTDSYKDKVFSLCNIRFNGQLQYWASELKDLLHEPDHAERMLRMNQPQHFLMQ